MKKRQIDNPWLKFVLPVVLSTYGFIAGWIFGPILYPAPVRHPDTDLYTYGFHRNIVVGVVGLIFGFCLALGILVQLHEQANIKIPDETLGHSDDPELDAINGWHPSGHTGSEQPNH